MGPPHPPPRPSPPLSLNDKQKDMKNLGVKVMGAVEDYDVVKQRLGEDVDTSGSRFNDAFRIARAEKER